MTSMASPGWGRSRRLARLAVTAVTAVTLGAGCRESPVSEATIVIRDVTVIDGTGSGPKPGMSVAIKDSRIVAVGAAADIPAVGSAATIDGRGKYLIPGLTDMHAHFTGYAEHALALFLANGVTTVRELGGDLQVAGWVRQEVRAGRLLGPEVLLSGPVLDAPAAVRLAPDVIGGRTGILPVGDSATAVQAVDSLADRGVDQLAIGPLLSPAVYRVILAAATRRDLPVAGPVPIGVSLRAAIEAGQRTIEGDLAVALANSSQGAELAERLATRVERLLAGRGTASSVATLRRAADDSARHTYDLGRARALAAFAAERGVWFDPTLAWVEAGLRRHEREVSAPAELQYVPDAARRLVSEFPTEAVPDDVEAGRERFQAVLTTFTALVGGGAKFVAGSGAPSPPLVPGFGLRRELELLVRMGLTPEQAIQAATRNAARATGRSHQVGTIEKGRRADLVLLDADPLADVRNLGRVNTVIARGRLLDRATLDRMLADARVYAEPR